MNQTALAALAGVQKQAQVHYEAGDRSPNADYLMALATAGADIRYILTGQRDGPAPEALSAEERVMLDYFRQASAPVRKAALGALLSAAPATPKRPARAPPPGSVHQVISAPVTGGVAGGNITNNSHNNNK